MCVVLVQTSVHTKTPEQQENSFISTSWLHSQHVLGDGTDDLQSQLVKSLFCLMNS